MSNQQQIREKFHVRIVESIPIAELMDTMEAGNGIFGGVMYGK